MSSEEGEEEEKREIQNEDDQEDPIDPNITTVEKDDDNNEELSKQRTPPEKEPPADIRTEMVESSPAAINAKNSRLQVWWAAFIGGLVIVGLLVGILVVLIQHRNNLRNEGGADLRTGQPTPPVPSLMKTTMSPTVGTQWPSASPIEASRPPSAEIPAITFRPSSFGSPVTQPVNIESPPLVASDARLIEAFTFFEKFLEETAPESPQMMAIEWLVHRDPTLPDFTTDVLQRFALVTLFFATGGASWLGDRFNFLSGAHVCEWNNGFGAGVTCGKPDQVTEVVLRKWIWAKIDSQSRSRYSEILTHISKQ